MDRHIGVAQPTLSDRVTEIEGGKYLNLASGNIFRVTEIVAVDAATMKQTWETPMSGSDRIARNYIPQAVGLEAVAYCEKMVA